MENLTIQLSITAQALADLTEEAGELGIDEIVRRLVAGLVERHRDEPLRSQFNADLDAVKSAADSEVTLGGGAAAPK